MSGELAETSFWTRRRVLAVWLLCLIPLLALLGEPTVNRTQEARVLETARQMCDADWRGWLTPMLNGEPRLQKPPLAYWMTAGSFRLLGVSEFAGRLPGALCAWLTLGVTCLAGAHLFGRRAGVLAMAGLMGSYFFFRYGKLAETDTPAMLFVTLAIYGALHLYGWEGSAASNQAGSAPRTIPPEQNENAVRNADPTNTFQGEKARDGAGLWLHLFAAATGLAFMVKGGPGAFPLVFLLACAVVLRQWRPLQRFVTSGAFLTLLLVALPWYGYIWFSGRLHILQQELRIVVTGEDHSGRIYDYLPQLLLGVLPWCVLTPLAMLESARPSRWKIDPKLRLVWMWFLAIFIPLCAAGNKQAHYLLPVLPPLMILTGWLVDYALQPACPVRLRRGVRLVVGGTILGCLAAAPAVLATAWLARAAIAPADVAMALLIGALPALAWIVYRRRGAAAGFGVTCGGVAVALCLFFGAWKLTLPTETIRTTAQKIQVEFGPGPYVFYPDDHSLPLCWAMRTAIPILHTPQEIARRQLADAQLVVIVPSKPGAEAVNVPPPLRLKRELGQKGQCFRIYQALSVP